ncbi:hypothetical protein CTI12_AA121880 [Artemisia annua]|uniref:Uncharacterized protein n=1 Tax=Artemisia annua TaxID=35608 RepID=A0A2U1PRI1_ARTAN|nr:hypothetical protein CTI12_AA121880 [Artemisia annua]
MGYIKTRHCVLSLTSCVDWRDPKTSAPATQLHPHSRMLRTEVINPFATTVACEGMYRSERVSGDYGLEVIEEAND